ncbi:MAG TPA: potassium-transporting ATPase subunit KdpC [Bacteroidota bacterium]
MVLKQLRIAVTATLIFTAVTGVAYPLFVTGVGQLLFPGKANGSLVTDHGKIVGSELIGQPFSDPKYFWSRLSATSPMAYNASASGGSNLGPLNPDLVKTANERVQALRTADPQNHEPIPVDLVTSSGSGLDPHISVAGALFQAERVARSRHLRTDQVRSLVMQHVEGRQFGFLGEPRVNVLALNLALDNFQTTGGVK